MECGATRAIAWLHSFATSTQIGRRNESKQKFAGECLDQSELVKFVTGVFERLGLTYAITGSHASIAYGENRFTNDIDVIARIEPNELQSFINEFPRSEFYVSDDGAAYAAKHGGQFNIIHDEAGKIDVIIPRDARWPDQFARRKRLPLLENLNAWFVSPEDLILSKMQAYEEGGSEKHLRDIAGVLKIHGDAVDRDYIVHWAERLGFTEIWNLIISRV
jgi:hypothetical protein